MSIRAFIFWLFLCALVIIAAAQLVKAETEQQLWIHRNRPDCCSHLDCLPATVVRAPDGWIVDGAYNIVPFLLVIPWPFGIPYACITNRRAHCLFMESGL